MTPEGKVKKAMGGAQDADSIMALADAFRKSGSVEDENALRAAVERLVRENALLWANLSELQQTWADNKPAVAYKERVERAERERDAAQKALDVSVQVCDLASERMKNDAKKIGMMKILRDGHTAAEQLANAEKRVNEWKERAERAEQDAARYRWLRGGSDIPAHSVRWGRWEINCWQGANGWQNLLCSELDAAIDAAMKEKK